MRQKKIPYKLTYKKLLQFSFKTKTLWLGGNKMANIYYTKLTLTSCDRAKCRFVLYLQ